jgi:hypothetical protein
MATEFLEEGFKSILHFEVLILFERFLCDSVYLTVLDVLLLQLQIKCNETNHITVLTLQFIWSHVSLYFDIYSRHQKIFRLKFRPTP